MDAQVNKDLEEKPIYRDMEMKDSGQKSEPAQVAESKPKRFQESLELDASNLIIDGGLPASPRKQRHRSQAHVQIKRESTAVLIQRTWRLYSTVKKQRSTDLRMQHHQLQANILLARKIETAVSAIQYRFRAKQRRVDVKSMVLNSDVVIAMPGTVQGRSGWYNMQGMIVELQIKGGHNWKITRGPCDRQEWEKHARN